MATKGITGEENLVEAGDLVKRMIASHYTGGQRSDAIGVVLAANYPLARVYFLTPTKKKFGTKKF